MKLSARQAAKQVGVSTPTIARACKSGRLSYEVGERGGYLIDPAELFRVFPAVTANGNDADTTFHDATPNNTAALLVEVKMLREQLGDLKEDRDHWREQAVRLLVSATNLEPGEHGSGQASIDATTPLQEAARPGILARLLSRRR